MTRLTDKTALVTGGSRGIGAAIVKRLAAEGARVAFTYTQAEDKAQALASEIRNAGGEALAIRADSADTRSVEAAVEQTAKAFGGIHILVNNAGVIAFKSIDDHEGDLADVDRMLAVNLSGVSATVRAVTKHMGEGGRIVSIGSSLGERMGALSGLGDYAASKAAVASYTRGWAWDLGKKGITVNTVQPGPVATDMNPDNTDFAESMKGGLALGRYGHVDEIASAVAFLVSPEASYITGTTLNVDGGQNA